MNKAIYSEADLAEIATAIGKEVADIRRHKRLFETAGYWYQLGSGWLWKEAARRFKPERQDDKDVARVADLVPSRKARQRLEQIGRTARKLLGLLGVNDPSEAPDGPGDFEILQILAYAEPADEEDVIRDTARIGRLVDIIDAISAAEEFERRASIAADEVRKLRQLSGRGGHEGDAAVNSWLALMLVAYERITGKTPATSVGRTGRTDEGVATGPLIRFLQAAGRPLGIHYDEDAWRSRVRTVLKAGGDKK